MKILFVSASGSAYDPTHAWSTGSNGFAQGKFVYLRMQYDTNAHIIDSYLSALQVKVGGTWLTNTADNPQLRQYFMGSFVKPAVCRVPPETERVRVTLNYWRPRWRPFGIGDTLRGSYGGPKGRGQRAINFASPALYKWLVQKVRRNAWQTVTAEFDLEGLRP